MKEVAIRAFVGTVGMLAGALLHIAWPLQIEAADKFREEDQSLILNVSSVTFIVGTGSFLMGLALVSSALNSASGKQHIEDNNQRIDNIRRLMEGVETWPEGEEKREFIKGVKELIEKIKT